MERSITQLSQEPSGRRQPASRFACGMSLPHHLQECAFERVTGRTCGQLVVAGIAVTITLSCFDVLDAAWPPDKPQPITFVIGEPGQSGAEVRSRG